MDDRISVSAHEKDMGACFWCRIPRARKGIVVGVIGSVLVHAGLLGAVAYSAGTKDDRRFVQPTRTIYVGTFVIKARKPSVNTKSEREI